ncbi:MAG TPA: glycosyltransferase [Gemmatimonadales bacterium]|nr:glycosyltransferase [Gemmatimonadales bacterium]
MHVALYFYDRLPVKGYGGTQRVVVWLARGLAELGHRVTLIAGAGSRVPEATLVPVDVRLARRPDFDVAPFIPRDADLLHSFVPLRVPPASPWVWTLEGNLKRGETAPANTIYVSADHARRNGSVSFVYNGLDPAEFVFRAEKADYDLFLGRLHKEKGYHWAIEGCRRTGRKLVVAGGWRPSLSRLLKFVGSVDGAEKAEWLAGARCLWMPALWDEPFGLTLAEALVSGTPVLGTRRGSLPEIVSPDVGALGDTLEDLVQLVETAARKDPHACRERALRHFSHRAMAAEYVRFYRHYLETGSLPAGRPAGASVGA